MTPAFVISGYSSISNIEKVIWKVSLMEGCCDIYLCLVVRTLRYLLELLKIRECKEKSQ